MCEELEIPACQIKLPANLAGQAELGEGEEDPPDLQDPEGLLGELVDPDETFPLDTGGLVALLAQDLGAVLAINFRKIRARQEKRGQTFFSSSSASSSSERNSFASTA